MPQITQNNKPNQQEYSAGLMSQSFWFVEFKKYLKLKADGMSEEEIKELIISGNLFGAPNEYRAKRIYGYLYNRISKLDEAGIELFFSSDLATQKLLNLVCLFRQDRLFFEFVNEVYREKAILGTEVLDVSDARIFFKNKEVQSDTVATWTDGTKKRVQSCYFNFLTDANLLTVIDKKKKITPPLLDVALERYLEANGETSIIKALTGVY